MWIARRIRSVTTSYAAAKSMGSMPVTVWSPWFTHFRLAARGPLGSRWYSAAGCTLPVTRCAIAVTAVPGRRGSNEPQERGAVWTEERGARDERRGKAVPLRRPGGERAGRSVEGDRVRHRRVRLVGAQVIGLGLAGPVGGHGVTVPGDLLAGPCLGPAELRGHQRGGVRRGRQPAVADLDRRPGPAGEHVLEAHGALVAARVDDLGREIPAGSLDRPPELRPLADQAEQV